MDRLIEIGLSNAVVASLLAVLATLSGLVIRRPAVCHALWLLVLLKLVTPPLVSVTVRPPAPERPQPAPPSESVAVEPAVELEAWGDLMDDLVIPNEEAVKEEEAWGIATEPGVAEEEEMPASGEGTMGLWWWRVAAGAWAIGSLAWFGLAGWRVWRFFRALRHARPAPADLVSRVAHLAGQLGLDWVPEVRLVSGRLAPMVWGVRKPWLLVPERLEEQVGPAGLDTLLVHELAHIRRRDHLVRCLEFVALGLHWWNPVVWYARRELREAEEQCCDAWVVDALPGAGRTYATALVDVLDFLSEARPALPPLASGIGQVDDLKRRLTMILRGTTPPRLDPTAGLAVFGLALLLLPLVPTWAQTQEPKKDIIRVLELEQKSDKKPDLKRLEEELARRLTEIERIKKHIAEMRRAHEAETRKGEIKKVEIKKAEIKKAEEAYKKATAVLKDRVIEFAPKAGTTIRIEISGLSGKGDELKELARALEKALPGKEKRVIIIGGGEHKHGGQAPKPATVVRPKVPETPKVPMAPKPPAPPKTPKPGSGFGLGGGDHRMHELERRVESLMRELENLRRELHRGPGRPGGPGGGGPGPRGPVGPGFAPGGGGGSGGGFGGGSGGPASGR